jgi:UDP-N-acetyl-D-mannosaminuronic acid transferase (WecB/TagA/CpsF family)
MISFAGDRRPEFCKAPHPEFRESLLISDLCPVDGMPLVWIAHLLGIPIQGRLSGSDIFDADRARFAVANCTYFCSEARRALPTSSVKR